jgi:hypothetical protein
MPIARSKPPVPPNTSLLFGHNATALLPHRASYRRNIRLRIGQRAYSDRLLGFRKSGGLQRAKETRRGVEERLTRDVEAADPIAVVVAREHGLARVRRVPELAVVGATEFARAAAQASIEVPNSFGASVKSTSTVCVPVAKPIGLLQLGVRFREKS